MAIRTLIDIISFHNVSDMLLQHQRVNFEVELGIFERRLAVSLLDFVRRSENRKDILRIVRISYLDGWQNICISCNQSKIIVWVLHRISYK